MIHKIYNQEFKNPYYDVKYNTTDNVFYMALRNICSSNMDFTYNIRNHILYDLKYAGIYNDS